MYVGLHVKYPLFLSGYNETLFFLTGFCKILKFHENPSSGSQVVPVNEWMDMTKLMVTCRNFANMPKKGILDN